MDPSITTPFNIVILHKGQINSTKNCLSLSYKIIMFFFLFCLTGRLTHAIFPSSCHGYTGKCVPGEAGPVPDMKPKTRWPSDRAVSENVPPPARPSAGCACAARKRAGNWQQPSLFGASDFRSAAGAGFLGSRAIGDF